MRMPATARGHEVLFHDAVDAPEYHVTDVLSGERVLPDDVAD